MLQSIICTNAISWLNSKIRWKRIVKFLYGQTVFTYYSIYVPKQTGRNWEVFFVILVWLVDFSGKTDLSALHKAEQRFNIQNYFHMRIPT